MEEFQNAWEKIVDIGYNNYSKLTREQRVWFNVEPLITDGLWSHYVNYGADKNSDTIEDLKYLNFNFVAEQLSEFNNIYFPNGIPKGPDDRQEQLGNFDEDKLEDYIEEMDDKFWDISDDLESVLFEHIIKTGIGK